MNPSRIPLPAPTPPRVESRHGCSPVDLRNRLRRVLRLADGSDRQQAGVVGEADAGGGDRVAGAVHAECRADDAARDSLPGSGMGEACLSASLCTSCLGHSEIDDCQLRLWGKFIPLE